MTELRDVNRIFVKVLGKYDENTKEIITIIKGFTNKIFLFKEKNLHRIVLRPNLNAGMIIAANLWRRCSLVPNNARRSKGFCINNKIMIRRIE